MRSRQTPFWLGSLSVFLAFLGATASRGAPVVGDAVYRLERHGGGLGVELNESAVILSLRGARSPRWIIEERRQDRSWCGARTSDGKCAATDITVHRWADTERCSSLFVYAEGLADLRSSRATPSPIFASDTPVTTLYRLGDQAQGAAAEGLTEVIGPLTVWWEAAETSIKDCWTANAPLVGGAPLASRLSAGQADEVRR
jgi:hypothetical protein